MKTYLIIEDEEPAFNRLRNLISEIDNQLVFIKNLCSVKESVEWFKTHAQPDLVFMDIQLADGNSFEIFKHVKITCPLVFITAFDQYALEAFKVNSIDYILKPVKKAELAKMIEQFNIQEAQNNIDYSNLQQMMQQTNI